jgi:hypothetical protein
MAGKHKSLQERSRRQERRREHEIHGDSNGHVARTVAKRAEKKLTPQNKLIDRPIEKFRKEQA